MGLGLHKNQLSGPLPDAWGRGPTFPAMTVLNLVRSTAAWNPARLSDSLPPVASAVVFS